MSKCPFLLSFFVVVGVELCTAWVAPLLCGAVSAYDLVDGVCGMGSIFLKFKNLALFHCAVKELQRLWMLCEWENEKLNFCCCIECAAGRGPVELVDGG